jgi:hypothetical protein
MNGADLAFERTVAGHTAAARRTLTDLRALVLATAKATPGVGSIEEGIRWGQHSFLTSETGSGSTIRIDVLKSDPDKCAVYFHCQSGLVGLFRETYGTKLAFEGKRAIIVEAGKNLPIQALGHCIGLALTHHLRKKPARKRAGRT